MKILQCLIVFGLLVGTATSATWEKLGLDIIGQNDKEQMGRHIASSKDGFTFAANGNQGGAFVNDGIIRVYQYTNGQWSPKGQPIVGEVANDYLAYIGMDMSGDGNRLVAHNYDSKNLNRPEYIKVFEYDGNDWVLLGNKIEFSGPKGYAPAMAINADGTIFASGQWETNRQRIVVYEFDGTNWQTKGQSLYHNSRGPNGMGLQQIDMSDDGLTLIIGISQWGWDYNTYLCGYVQIWRWNEVNKNWENIKNWRGDRRHRGLGSWASMNAAGNIVAYADYGSQAKVFSEDSGWNQVGKTISIGGISELKLSDNGDRIAVSVWNKNNEAGENVGMAQIFDWDGTNWNLVGDTIYGDSTSNKLGHFCELSGNGNHYFASNYAYKENDIVYGRVRVYGLSENPTCDSFSCPSGQIHIDAVSTTQCTGIICTDSDNCCKDCNACDNIGQEIHTGCTTSSDTICRCSIGFAGNEAACTGCQDGSTFTDAPNHTTCRQCSMCNADDGQEIATACTTKSNTVCRCRAGFSGDGETCTACTSEQTFTDVSDQSQCITCDSCAETGQKIEEKCTTTSDAVCQCTAGHAGGGSTCTVCVSGETFTHIDDQDTCKACNTCSGEGQEIGTHCTTTSDTQCRCVRGYAGNGDSCDVCVAGSTFSHIVGQTSCKNCDICNETGQEVATACSTTLDTVCRCIAGFAGDEDGCTACDDGSTFTNISGELSCKRCNTCEGTGQEINTQCTTTTDAVCRLVNCGSSIGGLDGNGIASCVDNTKYGGDECTATCNRGYDGDSVQYLCNSAGDWEATTSVLSCTAKDCGATIPGLTSSETGDCSAGVTIYGGDNCAATCAPGYNGSEKSYTCSTDGVWEPVSDAIVCTQRHCEDNGVVSVAQACFCGGSNSICPTTNWCYGMVCHDEAKYPRCTPNFYTSVEEECICASETTTCDSGKFCYDNSCNNSFKCKSRDHVEKSPFYGAKIKGEWDVPTKMMTLRLPVTSDIQIESIKWLLAQNQDALAYSKNNTGGWTLDTTNSCKTEYKMRVKQDTFFGEGSNFTLTGTQMKTSLRVAATEKVIQKFGGYEYNYNRKITNAVPVVVNLKQELKITARFHIRTAPNPTPPPRTNVHINVPFTTLAPKKSKFLDECSKQYNDGTKCTDLTQDENGNAVITIDGTPEQINDAITTMETNGYPNTGELGPYDIVTTTTTTVPPHMEFIFMLEAHEDFSVTGVKTVSMKLEVHTRSCINHTLDDGGVRVTADSLRFLEQNNATQFVWEMNTDGTKVASRLDHNLCVETLTWTFSPAGYEPGLYNIGIEYTMAGGLGTFISDAEINIEKADVLDDIGFDAAWKMYADIDATEESTKFSLGQKFFIKITLSSMVVDAKTITCKDMMLKQNKNGIAITTNMTEAKYNPIQKQDGTNKVICGAELESTHFHATVDGYDTSLNIDIWVEYEDGIQQGDRRRRRLRIPFSELNQQSFLDEVLANTKREPDVKSLEVSFEIEPTVVSLNTSLHSMLGRTIVGISLVVALILIYSFVQVKHDEYVPLLDY